MNPTNRLLYNMLVRGSRALAGYAAGDLVEKRPQAAEPLGGDPFGVWQVWLADRLDELAAAVATERPELFAADVRAATAALLARGLSVDYVVGGLESLRDALAKKLPGKNRQTALAYLDQGLAAAKLADTQADRSLLTDSPHGQLASRYLLAILEGDRRRACDIVLDAARQGHAVPEIYQLVLQPAQEEIGRMWSANEINVAEEHFSSATTRRLMAELVQYALFKPAHGRALVTAAVAGNLHDLGLQMVADLFEMEGWRVVHLGANVPALDVAQAVEDFRADLLGLSAARSTQLEPLRDTIAAVRQRPKGTDLKIIVGGAGFVGAEDLFLELGSDAYAKDAVEAVAIGNRFVGLANGAASSGGAR